MIVLDIVVSDGNRHKCNMQQKPNLKSVMTQHSRCFQESFYFAHLWRQEAQASYDLEDLAFPVKFEAQIWTTWCLPCC